MQAEDVRLLLAFVGTQLDAGNELYSRTRGSKARGTDSLDRVMIGQRDGSQPCFGRCRNHHFRRVCPVGCGGVEVEIDMPRWRLRGVSRHGA